MDSSEIKDLMMKDQKIKKIFKGVYPIDLILENLDYPSLIVVNLDSSEKKGSHWVVLHYTLNHIVEQFDSIGRKPDEHIINILFKKKLTYKYNNKRLQSSYTNTCGLFCLFYSYYSSRNEDMVTILERFGDTYKENEFIVIKFYTDYFKKNFDIAVMKK